MAMSLLEKHNALEWFKALSEEERIELIKKNNIPRSIEDGTLTNGDVLSMYKSTCKFKNL